MIQNADLEQRGAVNYEEFVAANIQVVYISLILSSINGIMQGLVFSAAKSGV